MKRTLFFLFAVAFVLAMFACTATERKGLKDDAGAYVHAPEHPDGSIDKDVDDVDGDGITDEPLYDGQPDYDSGEVAIAGGTQVASKAAEGDWVGALYYVGVGLATIGIGWFKRKYLKQKATGAKAVLVQVANKILGGK